MHQDAVDGLDASEDSRSLRRCVDRGMTLLFGLLCAWMKRR